VLQKGLLEHYNTIKKLGSGASGDVVLSINRKSKQQVAVKSILIEKLLKVDPKAELIKNEIQSHWDLQDCEGIVKMHEIFVGRNSIYLVLEY
jgi:serine/threonine protein kinase